MYMLWAVIEYKAIGDDWCKLAALDSMEGVINNLMQC